MNIRIVPYKKNKTNLLLDCAPFYRHLFDCKIDLREIQFYRNKLRPASYLTYLQSAIVCLKQSYSLSFHNLNQKDKTVLIQQDQIKIELRQTFNQIRKYSSDTNKYSIYGTLENYKSSYDNRVKIYLSLNRFSDIKECDFITREIKFYKKQLKNNWFALYDDFYSISEEIKFSSTRIIEFLTSKLQSLETINSESINLKLSVENKNKHPLIFTDEGYKLFEYLVLEYIVKDPKTIKVKYCEIYHYIKDYEKQDVTRKLLLCNQLEYIDFLKNEYNVLLSKIQPQTYEYKDNNKQRLDQLRRIILK
ncbi:MAG TPA: hypothetical protein PLL66_01595 [Bacteroidales bacterium]|nr:hypothetical protein [Bacteroidales bacterium]